jgi:hypothetical protein
MESKSTAPTALVTALALAQEHGGAAEALRLTGLDLDGVERFDGVPEQLEALFAERTKAETLRQALALGFLAGRVAHRPRPRRSVDPSAFLLDHDLLVRSGEGQAILRLPWMDEDLFVGRQLPDIAEIPDHVRILAVENYRAGLAGERRSFAFSSYGHTYTVEAVPVRGDDGDIKAVLGIATLAAPPVGRLRAAASYESTAEELEHAAGHAEYLAALYRAAGHPEAEARQREAAEKAFAEARQARANAWQERSNGPRHTA